MTYDEFWNGQPKLVIAYRKAEEHRIRRSNFEQWRMGIYISNALQATVGNMLRKKGSKPFSYPDQPLSVTAEEAEARRIKEANAAEDRLREKMMNLVGR